MKILIIEDELLIQMSLKKILEKKGAEVFTESSGKKAIELIQQTQFDTIVCDLMLQDITGFDVIEESKKLYNEEQIKQLFVIMTAYSSEQVIGKASKYGCVILQKPFENIQEAINVILSARK